MISQAARVTWRGRGGAVGSVMPPFPHTAVTRGIGAHAEHGPPTPVATGHATVGDAA